LIEKIGSFAEYLILIALSSAGGIGTPSITSTIPHGDHIKQRFGHNHRFMRCGKYYPEPVE
jgi:hypothetical protein